MKGNARKGNAVTILEIENTLTEATEIAGLALASRGTEMEEEGIEFFLDALEAAKKALADLEKLVVQ